MHRLDALKVALRVLGAFRDSQSPDPLDVAILEMFVRSGKAARSPDELACHVIESVLQNGLGPRFASAKGVASVGPESLS